MSETIENVFLMLEAAGYERPPYLSGSGEAARRLRRAVRAWGLVLADYTAVEVRDAAITWMRRDKYGKWPVPGKIATCAEEGREAHGLSADEAWGLLKRLIAEKGMRSLPCFTRSEYDERRTEWASRGNTGTSYSDPIPFLVHSDLRTAVAISRGLLAVGGWHGLGRRSESDEVADRAAFRNAYRAASRRQEVTPLAIGANQGSNWRRIGDHTESSSGACASPSSRPRHGEAPERRRALSVVGR